MEFLDDNPVGTIRSQTVRTMDVRHYRMDSNRTGLSGLRGEGLLQKPQLSLPIGKNRWLL